MNKIITVNEYLTEMSQNRLGHHFNLVLAGEDGTGKEYYARKIHKLQRGKEKFILIDFEIEPTAQQEVVDSLITKQPEKFMQDALRNTLFFRRLDFLEGHVLQQIQDFLRKVNSFQIDKEIHFLKSGILCSIDEPLSRQTNRIIESVLQEFFVLKVFIPPLRERAVELHNIIEEVIGNFDQKSQEKLLKATLKSKDILTRYSWPGNLNQLRSVLEEASLILEKNGSDLQDYFEKKFSNHVICSSSEDHNKDFFKDKKGLLEKCLSGIVCCTYCS